MKNLIIITGPTACGKTATAINLAKMLNGEIISADSMQIYKNMDIGTAKPTISERNGVIHHLIDIIEPTENFSVAIFQKLANQAIIEVYNRGKIPILVGGTGFYINAVAYKNALAPKESTKLQEHLQKNATSQELYEYLQKVDPLSASRIHPNNVQRVSSALAYYESTGKPISHHKPQKEPRYNNRFIILTRDRQSLYNAINKRVEIMFAKGLPQEVKYLLENGVTSNTTAMQAIGYKEMLPYLNDKCTLAETILTIQQNSRRYAKRQLTWFRHQLTGYCLNTDKTTSEEMAFACLKVINNFR
ncbi:MAG: tRNA (adenosine(37)-N6)-dimethylallyltransferase MiaA [Firmicutes bacterium]|nr:tRNA (adenosine(37)-N6)-dimethylallyltransferase MiaA [Bacillota bacterium]